MSVEFKLPQLAEGIDSADVASIYIKAGDTVEPGQEVMELETDKAVMQLPCPKGGKVGTLKVKTGDTVKTGQVLFTIEEGAAANGSAPKSGGSSAAEKPAESSGGSKPAPSAPQKSAPTPQRSATAVATAPSRSASDLPIPAGPATRRLARELGVQLDRLRGTGPGGRITQEDVARAYAQQQGGGGGGVVAPPLPDFSKFGETEVQALTKLQKTSANNLSMAWQLIPHVTQHDLVDVTDLEAARKRFQESAPKGSAKVTVTALALKAAVASLKAFPQFNSSIDMTRGELILKKYYHIGVAVDTPNGLVVPVIRDVDQKTVLELAAELTELAEKARARKLELKDMQGGTFTITNLGGIGGTAFTPIVNYPEVAILGMSRSQNQLQLVNGQVVQRSMLPLSLSYDHRVINGADAARFLVKLGGMLSDAFKLVVEC